LKKKSCYKEAVCSVCSIDIKSNEAGLLTFCKAHDLPLQTFSAEQLNAVSGSFTSSEFVRKTTGVDNVCERSAVLGSGGELWVKKHAGNGVTIALAISPYKVKFSEEAK
jgi:cobalt-precorrin 5A hydrolase